MRLFTALALTTALAIVVAATPVRADDWHHHHDDGRDFHEHEFHGHDFDHWRGGHWINDFHDGRHGWWWVVDGGWYFYPAPVYPYPDYNTPPTVVVEEAPAGAQVHYYCAAPAGYYPEIPQCATAWQKVITATAVAPAPQAAIVQQAPPPALSTHEADLQKLNAYAAQMQAVDARDPHAAARLKVIAKQVEAFRQSLFKRDYNAMDVLRDAEDLKKRIAARRAELKPRSAAAPVVVVPAPTVTNLPPGTTVTFPPQ